MITERIDHTLLRADATEEDIRGLCEEAVTYGFHSVCVNSSCVALCASLLKNTGIKVCTVIGFPLGAMSTTAKIAEATAAVKDGAEELDMVIHIGALKSGNWDYVRRDIGAVFGCLLLYYSIVPFCLLPCFPSVLHSPGTLSRAVSHALLCSVFRIGRRFSYHEYSLKKTATWKKRNN